MRLLVVEDDRAIAASLTEALTAEGHEVTAVGTGAAALAAVVGESTDRHEMVLLDLGLPDIDGRDVCREIRRVSDVPIIMVTARGDEVDRVLGLELGADDYVTKPFSVREVAARIRAVSRRGAHAPAATERPEAPAERVGALRIDRRARRAWLADDELALTAKEFDVLAFLAAEPGMVRSRTEILENVWDINWYGPTKTVDAHVAALRKKLGDRRWIAAVHSVGFRLDAPPP